MIQRVLSNLILNARDASEFGQRIEVAVKKHDNGVWLRVSDEGMGMTREVQERVFDPFYTTKPRGQGTGLGLAVVVGIVREMGSSIEVASTVGLGTTIALSIPVIDSHSKEHFQVPNSPE